MRRTVPLAVFAVVVVAVATLPAMGMAPTADSTTQANNGTTPGAQLSGVVGVQGAELDGALDQRAFAIQFTQAADNASKAAVLADRLQTVDERLVELRERKATIEAQHDAGEITDGKFRAEMAKIATEVRLLSRAANQTEQAAGGVPGAALEERGVNATAIQTLKDRANELTGPEVAEIARSIAGPDAGNSPGRGNGMPPDNETGPPGAGDGTDRGGPERTPGNDRADEASSEQGEERGGESDDRRDDERPNDDQAEGASGGNETNDEGDETDDEDDESTESDENGDTQEGDETADGDGTDGEDRNNETDEEEDGEEDDEEEDGE